MAAGLTRRLALIGAALLAGAGAAAAQNAPPPLFSEADAAAATATIHRYFAAFSAKDYAVFREVFNAPFVTSGREMAVIPTLEAVVQRYQMIRDPLDQADYSASRAVEIRLTPLHGASALANLHWQRLRKDGRLLNEGSEMMILAKVAGQWRITGNFGGDLRQFTAGAAVR